MQFAGKKSIRPYKQVLEGTFNSHTRTFHNVNTDSVSVVLTCNFLSLIKVSLLNALLLLQSANTPTEHRGEKPVYCSPKYFTHIKL